MADIISTSIESKNMRGDTDLFKAIADPTRREILRLLGEGERSAGELSEHFETGKPTLSHHFSVLRDADLIRSRREGQTVWYALNTTVVEDLITWATDIAGKVPGRRKARAKPWTHATR